MIMYDPSWRTRELRSADEAAELAKIWRPTPAGTTYPWPIRPDTGKRDLRA